MISPVRGAIGLLLLLTPCVICGDDAPREIFDFSTESKIESPPAISVDGTVYVASKSGVVYALSGRGMLKWKRSLNTSGVMAVALGPQNDLYVASNGIYAFDIRGKLKWHRGGSSWLTSPVAISPNGTIYCNLDDHLTAITPDGAILWQLPTYANQEFAPVIRKDGIIYAHQSPRPPENGAAILAVDSLGNIKWRYAIGEPITASPAIGEDGTLYCGGTTGNVYAIDPKGTLQWSSILPEGVFGSPVVDSNGVVYFAGAKGTLYAVNSAGSIKWSLQLCLAMRSGPCVAADGSVFVSGSVHHAGYLYRVNSDGTLAWKVGAAADSNSAIPMLGTGSPIIGKKGIILVGDMNGILYAYAVAAKAAAGPWPMGRFDSSGSAQQQ